MNTQSYENIRKSLRFLIRSFGVFSETTWTQFDVTYAQSQALFVVGESPGLHAKGLSHHLQLDKSTISRLLKDLAGKSLIEFKLNPTDHRLKEIHLTSAGKKLIRRLSAFGNKRSMEIFAHLTARQIKDLERALAPLR